MTTDRTGRTTVFLLPGLGLTGRLFDPVLAELGEAVEGVALDLPGFGAAAEATDTAVEAAVATVIDAIRHHAAPRWLIVGHSMGGKIASIVAARTLQGEAPLFGLAGVVLLAASPPSPEPMADAQRAEMLDWAAEGPLSETAARAYLDGNVAAPLPADRERLVLDAVRRAAPAAWRAWLSRGSREDWSDEVGALDLPARILAGADDPALGEEGQRAGNLPHYPRATVTVLDGARHLLPLERPGAVADAIRDLARQADAAPHVPADVARLIASDRVSARTRAALAGRAVPDDPSYAPRVLDPRRLATLRAVADRVVPQEGLALDLAARVDAQLARGEGDGWRFDDLPPDPEAYRLGLDRLTGLGSLGADEQDARLRALADGEDGPALAHWFEDARADLVRVWLAHPATMARIGYDGFATGGDGLRLTGFDAVAAGRRDAWEPAL